MCYDRLTDDDVTQIGISTLLRSELYCAGRNGLLAGVIVLAVLLVQGTPAWIIAVSVAGAVILGAGIHQLVMLAGATALRLRERMRPTA